MAYGKKVSRRRYRSNRYRRRYRRRRYRYKRYRRRYRRLRRYRPEYKRIEFSQNFNFHCDVRSDVTIEETPVSVIAPFYYDFVVIGANRTDNDVQRNVNINQGYAEAKRIGGKIRPSALRLFGTMSICSKTQVYENSDTGLVSVPNVNVCMVRMIVFQIRNGNNRYNPFQQEFSEVSPYIDKFFNYANATKGVVKYNGSDSSFYNNPEWLSRIFATHFPIRDFAKTTQTNSYEVIQYIKHQDHDKLGCIAKSPYRQGIGTYLKILKDKLYYFKPGTNGSFAFRCKTKRPYRMVWKEKPSYGDNLQNDQNEADAKNPIYITFIPVFPLGVNASSIGINLNCQLYYTDK